MKLHELIEPENIALLGKVDSSSSLVDNLLSAAGIPGGNLEETRREILTRDSQGGTLLGRGIYFPHTRMESAEKFHLSLGISPKGIDLGAPDDRPVRFSFLIVSPLDRNQLLLNCRAAFLKLFMTGDYADRMILADSPEEVHDIIREGDVEVEEVLTAADVMETPVATVTPETTLRRILELMFSEGVESLPVVDESGKFRGAVGGREILRIAVPKFADNLSSLKFVRSKTPFEQILAQRDDTIAADIMEKDVLIAHPEVGLVQLAHMMLGSERRVIYIVDREDMTSFRGLLTCRNLITKVIVE